MTHNINKNLPIITYNWHINDNQQHFLEPAHTFSKIIYRASDYHRDVLHHNAKTNLNLSRQTLTISQVDEGESSFGNSDDDNGQQNNLQHLLMEEEYNNANNNNNDVGPDFGADGDDDDFDDDDQDGLDEFSDDQNDNCNQCNEKDDNNDRNSQLEIELDMEMDAMNNELEAFNLNIGNDEPDQKDGTNDNSQAGGGGDGDANRDNNAQELTRDDEACNNHYEDHAILDELQNNQLDGNFKFDGILSEEDDEAHKKSDEEMKFENGVLSSMDEFGNKYNFQDGDSSEDDDNGDSNSNNGDDAEDLEIELAADDKNLENQNSMTVQNVTISPGNSNNDDQDESFSNETCNSSSRTINDNNTDYNNTSAMIDSDIFDEDRDLRTPTVDFFECESHNSSIEELIDYGCRIGPPDDFI